MKGLVSLLSQKRSDVIGSNPDNALISIAYNNSNFQYFGRVQDTGTGKWGGWAIRIVSKWRGTGILNITATVTDVDAASTTSIMYFVNGSADGTQILFTELAETFTGTRKVTIQIPLTGIVNTVELYPAMNGPACFATTQQIIINSYTTGSLGVISTWTQGPKYIQTIGDSWCSHINSWPRLMDVTKWKLYPIANPSFKISDMDSDYNYDYVSVLNTTDPTMDGIIISSGVNDYGAGVTVPNFQTSLLSLIDKVRIKQPVPIPIFLVRVPNNGGSLFGQYGTAMSNAAGLRSNVTYVDTSSLDASMTFTSDGSHLDGSSKVVFANFVNAALIAGGL